MRKITLFLASVLISLSLTASGGYEVKYLKLSEKAAQLSFELSDYEISLVSLQGLTYTKIRFDASVNTKLKGFAELPYIHSSVMLDAERNVTLVVTGEEYTDYILDYPMLPSRGVIYRDQDPSAIPYQISPSSLRDEWYPQNISELTDPYILRDVRGTTVYVYPFRYNAVQNILRVYTSVTIELVENDLPSVNPLPAEVFDIEREMQGIYNSVFVNYGEEKDDLTIGQYGDILVVTTARDESAIQPYIDWKLEKGFHVTKQVVATGTNVKSTIQSAYTANNNILYVQLVGDWADIKCDLLSGYAPMDPQLGCVVGSDQQPDICIGRISAGSPADVTVQVNKIIEYEKNPEMGATWYKNAIGIASNQGPGDDNEYDYAHIDVIYNDRLSLFTYDNFTAIYDPSANVQMVKDAVNNGATVINYTGHGSPTSWGSSGFSNSNVAQLTNGNKLPFIVSVACNNGNFHDPGDCFAEAWVKKSNGGAVMFLGATISQPWDPPMRGQDYFMDAFIGGYDYNAHPGQNGINTNEQRTTLGAMVFNGLVLMTTESGGSSDWETAKTWTIFGDPSMQARSDMPAPLTLSNNVILTGVPFTTMITSGGSPVEGAMVCLSQNGEYFSAITDATGSVSISNTLTPGTAKLVVTAFNTETKYADVTVVPPGGPFIVVNSCAVNDAAGNGNGLADYGESILLNVAAENVGSDPAYGVGATLISTDPYQTITNATHSFGDIPAGQIVQGTGAFELDVAENVPDGHTALFEVEFTDGNKTLWTSSMTITFHAPVMELGTFTIDDQGGNGNGKIDPGETVELSIEIVNDGSAAAYGVTGELVCPSPFITINQSIMAYGDIEGGETEQKIFSVTADANTPEGQMVTFNLEIEADMGIAGNGSFNAVVGQIPVLIIDLDDNHNSAPAIQQAMQNFGIVPEVTQTFPTDLSVYSSLFVCLGIYSDNHVLTTAEGQLLAGFLNNGGMIYMEGGDTWYYDTQTAVHPMFKINPTGDGTSDLGTVAGQAGTFTEGMTFSYSGENNYIDHIEPVSPAFKIFQNQSPAYGTGVAYDAGTYKTIGASHEFGGLNDGASPSTKDELMAEYLEFFGIGGQELLAYFMADETQICEEDMVLFTDYSQGNVNSWSWEFPGGDPSASAEQNPTVIYNLAGEYDVILTVSDGTNTNTYTRTEYIKVDECTSVQENLIADLTVYPNPSDGNLNIKLQAGHSGLIHVEVFNLLGIKVLESQYNNIHPGAALSFDMTGQNPGMYFMVIDTGIQRYTERIQIR
ncbi:MAG: T9SS type A sorting domain-containing protein [Bacteroidales bacterium]|nr:T9SS type A sorting domain-containing protein [Bacteroidales bacterium]